MSTKKQNDYLTPIKENLSKLELGKPYMFTKLCDTLGIARTTNKNSIIAILKALDSVVERVEEGKKHIILGLRTEQVEIIDNRGKSEGSRGNYDGIFKDNLVNSLLYFCVQIAENRGAFKDGVDDFVVTTSKHNMMCEIGIRNRHNSYIAKNQPLNFCNQLSLERVVLDFAMTRINNNTSKAFDKSLESAVKSGLVIQENSMGVVRYKPTKWEKGSISQWDKTNVIKGFAKKKERIDIELMKQKFANDMNFKTVGSLYSTNNVELISNFHDKVNKYTVQKYGILESYPLIELHMKKSVIDNYLQRFEGITLEDLVEIGNEKFLKNQNKNFKTSHTKYLKNGSNTKNAYVQGMDNYLEQIDKITHHVIDINSRKLLLLKNGDLVQDMETGEIKPNEYYNDIDSFIDVEENSYYNISTK